MKVMSRLHTLMQSRFARNISILAGGTAFAQLVGLISLPFLTRIYTPEDFTILATYASILALLISIVCLRFEVAIPIPEELDDAVHLLVLSIISVISITLLTWFVVSVGETWINKQTNQRLEGYLWLLPIGVFFSGLYKALQYWVIREKVFSLVAKTRMTQAIASNTTQLALGFMGVTPFGLLFGQLLNSGAGCIRLIKYFIQEYKSILSQISVAKLKSVFGRYDRFPKYSTWEALTNSAGIQVPILIIATFTIGVEAGFLILAMRLLSMPMKLISKAVGQVYLAEAAEKYHKGELESFTRKTIVMLAKVGFFPLFLVCATAPLAIPFILGDGWQRTGVLISWMVPWFFIQFIASPISMSLHITNNQIIAMLLQVTGLVIRAGSVWVAGNYFNEWVGEVYAISSFVFYLLYLIVVIFLIKKNGKYQPVIK
ncbi:oligosaccharide flippase family protein [Colwellia sp. E2M01]|uniref:oligosaccharide flippase family protein n=1 Tax=Colwellia sp. E2M01 TaxID=2841561 RepID=UPI001C0944EE|nr:oligosaccharide flippase family protein [Colwellia sp. E2M01]MBU2869203.1 oligosaccharide flippase family protein [Colwellia sp. E2M01]